MKYLAFVATEGAQPQEALDYMHREWPAYAEELDRRGGWRLGRELDHPRAPVTVRVREGRTLITDGPFAETKEYVGGFDLFESAGLQDAIEVESMSPVARFCAFEIRPFERLVLGSGAQAFADRNDADGLPYLLMAWVDGEQLTVPESDPVFVEYEAWRERLDESGVFVLGGLLSAPGTATTLRFRDGEVRADDGPFLRIEPLIAGIDVIRAADRERATQIAAGHPLARHYTIELVQFHSD
jgi:hypothetical protein